MRRRDYVESVLTETAILGIGVVTGLVVARLLQPEGRGLLAVALIWPQVMAALGFCSLGDVTCHALKLDRDRWRHLLAAAVAVGLGCAVLTVALGEVLLRHVAGELPADLRLVVRGYLTVFVPANFAVLLWLGAVQSRGDFRAFNRLRLVVPCAYLAGIGAAFAAGHVSVPVVLAANLLATVLVAAIAVARLFAMGLSLPGPAELRRLAGLVAGFHPATLLGVLAAQADQLVATQRLGAAEIGCYVVAVSCAGAVVGAVGNGVQRVALAHVSDPDRAVARERGARTLALAAVAALAACAVALVAVPWLVPLLYGPEFQEAVPIGRWLAIAAGFAAIRTVGVQVMRGSGEAWVGVAASGTVAVALLGAGGLARSATELAVIAVAAQGLGAAVLAAAVLRWRRRPAAERAGTGGLVVSDRGASA